MSKPIFWAMGNYLGPFPKVSDPPECQEQGGGAVVQARKTFKSACQQEFSRKSAFEFLAVWQPYKSLFPPQKLTHKVYLLKVQRTRSKVIFMAPFKQLRIIQTLLLPL